MKELINIKIECTHCKNTIQKTIHSADLQEECIDCSKQMGPETMYSMYVIEECPSCNHRWEEVTVYEYPEGHYSAYAK